MPDVSDYERIGVFGGVYSNHHALRTVLADAASQGVEKLFCLGDIGGFGPHPDRSAELLRQHEISTIQGNYDDSVGNALDDCQCGYTDPRDNAFAQISYDYTLSNTDPQHRAWMRDLPMHLRLRLGGQDVLLAHGSPRQVNEFLWESTTPDSFIERLLGEHQTDLLLLTHTGLHWNRLLPQAPGRGLVNVGAIGRPANDGDTAVWYSVLTWTGDVGAPVSVEARRVEYDHETLASEMRAERLPDEFVETILTGWWTTCLEILPAKERARGQL